MTATIGIDLGTTNSAVAVMKNGKPEIIPNSSGNRTTPSVVAFYNHEIVIGEIAKALMVSGIKDSASCLVGSVKRKMGSGEKIQLDREEYTPQHISALILKQLKQDAERYLGEPVEEAVISVPAYFNDIERQATIDAGAIAGLRVEKIINEPTAAAVAYGLEYSGREQKILVYDLGGGTFDVTVLHLYEGIVEVKASTGDKYLGGDDFDEALIRYALAKYRQLTGKAILDEPGPNLLESLGRAWYYLLKLKCEEVKKQLSFRENARLVLVLHRDDGQGDYGLDLEITRAEFEELIRDRVEKTRHYMDEAFAIAKWSSVDLDQVLLVGGSTRIPLVEAFVAETLGKKPKREINPDEAVALGAAVDAGLKRGDLDENQALIVMDVTPFTWGTSCTDKYHGTLQDGMFARIIQAQTKIPCSGRELFYTVTDGQTQLDGSIYIGESEFASENTLVQEFLVKNIPPAPAGQEAVELEYRIDANGNLIATATVVSTGATTEVTVKAALNRMSAAELTQSQQRLNRDWERSECSKKAKSLINLIQTQRCKVESVVVQRHLAELLQQVETALLNNNMERLQELDGKITDYLFNLTME
ncbi:MAG TPA: Hsp70 family protein [Bacillota bacterium]|nr:Hsp70 family protein [Bacillota bacterium]